MCKHPETVWHRWVATCHRTVALEVAKRLFAEEHKEEPWHDGTFTTWAKEFSVETPSHFSDGMTIWVAQTPQPEPDD